MKLLGKGAFTSCYKKSNTRVLLESSCPIKECMSLGWFPSSELFPKIYFADDNRTNTYEMKYYPKVSSLKQNLKPAQWEIYKQLREITLDYSIVKTKYDYANGYISSFKKLKNKRLSDTMIEAMEACMNYGSDIGFEISPRNVAVNKGNLILLDCFFHVSTLLEIKRKRG